jgi:type IV pilus assembly protein PilW
MGKTCCVSEKGYSLIEMLIVIAILAIVSTGIYLSFNSGQKEYGSRQSVLWMQQQARLAMMNMEKDLKMIGYGFVDVGTFRLNYYDGTSTPATMRLVDYNNNGGFQNTDTISFRYFDGSQDISKDVTISTGYADSTADTPVSSTIGFNNGDFYYICDPGNSAKNASLLQVSGVTADSKIEHADNPPTTENIFPATGYGAGCKVFNLGQGKFKQVNYSIDTNYNLVKQTRDDPSRPPVSHMIAQGIEDLQIRYQFKDGTWQDVPTDGDVDHDINNLRAVRISIIVRTRNADPTYKSAAVYQLTGASGNGGSHSGGGYKRMVMSTVISLRNMAFRP